MMHPSNQTFELEITKNDVGTPKFYAFTGLKKVKITRYYLLQDLP